MLGEACEELGACARMREVVVDEDVHVCTREVVVDIDVTCEVVVGIGVYV